MKDKYNVVYNVKQYRKAQGLTLEQLSNLSGVGISTVSDIENGKSHPTVLTLAKIATVLNVGIEELYTII